MKILGNVIKSKSDNRLYKAIKLKNEIQCLIISDSQAKRSSAALSVGVGSLQDPIQAQGLAHYLQHMLFMGTKKYPNENDYSNFLAKNFGHSNAYTSLEETNYFFEVASNAFNETLDRFAQFFISPLMSDSSSERQLNAVHSEHSKNLLNDTWRKYQLTKYLAKQGHPLNKFSTGDKYSLANPNLRQMLHMFYNKNYSSNLMKLVICGNQSPQQISRLVQQKFSEVPNRNYSRYKMLQRPYSNNFYNKIYKLLPIQDRKVLQISWTLNDKSKYYQNPPSTYLSYIVGHEGKGSLLSFLISQGLATGLSAGGSDAFDLYSEFEIKINLTKKGVENVKQVIQYTLYFMQFLKGIEPQKWVFDEIQDLNKMRFDYQQKRQGMQQTSSLAKKLQKRKIQQILAFPYFMKQWKPDLIKQYLGQINRQNMSIFLEAKQVQQECSLQQPIYKTKFAISDLDGLQARVCPVTMPPKNPFIPKNFDIFPLGSETLPSCIHKSEQFQIFYKKDHRFELPKMIMALRLYFEGSFSVRESLCRKIYIDMLTESLREFTYLGDTAETSSGIEFQNYFTLDISFNGFRDSTLKFVKPYLEKLFSFKPNDIKYFQTVKQKIQRGLSNYYLGDPYRLAYNLTSMATRHGFSTSPLDQLKQIKNITFEEVVEFGSKWSQKIYVQSFITGNLKQEETRELIANVEKIVKQKSQVLQKDQIGDIRAVKLKSGITWVLQQKLLSQSQENSAVVVHFQHQASTLKMKILQDLCYNFIKEPAFDYLRTKQQLGYIVMCLPDDNRGVLGMSILLQSAVKTSYELTQYVNTFLSKILYQKLNQINEKSFEQFKKSLRTSKEEKDKNLSEQASRFWKQIVKHTYMFDRKEKQLEQLDKVTLEEFKNFVDLIFYLNPKRLQIHLTSHKEEKKNKEVKNLRLNKQENIRVFTNADYFRKKMDLFPDFYSHL